MCGLDIEEDDSHHKESGLRRLARDESDLQKITTLLSTSMKNPFQVTEDEESSLLNIVTGQVPPNEVEDQLLNAQTTGLKYMDEFVDERLVKKEKTFFDTLSKLQLKTFADLKKPFKGTTKDSKAYSIKADRDLFSRLVVIARRREIDLENIFTYELASVPFSLAKLDGSLNKTAKSKLLQELECHGSNYPSLPSKEKPTSWIIDGMTLLQMLGHGKAATFGELASKILILFVVCSTRRQFSELTLFLTDMIQSTQSRKWKDSDDKMCQVMRCKFTVLQFQCQNCGISSCQVTLINLNWPNSSVNTGVVNMSPVFHLEKCLF